MPEPTDAELVSRIRAGDRPAGDLLVRRHTGLVKSIVRQLGPYPPTVDKDDLVQLGLLAVYRLAKDTGPSAWKPDAKGTGIASYAYWKVTRVVLNAKRAAARWRPANETDLPDDLLTDLAFAPAEAEPPDGPGPDLPPLWLSALTLAGDDVRETDAAARLGLTRSAYRRVLQLAREAVSRQR